MAQQKKHMDLPHSLLTGYRQNIQMAEESSPSPLPFPSQSRPPPSKLLMNAHDAPPSASDLTSPTSTSTPSTAPPESSPSVDSQKGALVVDILQADAEEGKGGMCVDAQVSYVTTASAQELIESHSAKELREFATARGVASSGKKIEIARAILASHQIDYVLK